MIPPFYRSPPAPLSVIGTLRGVLSDPASVIPAAIYHDWAVALPGPRFPVAITHPESVRAVLQDDGATFGRNRQLRALFRRGWGAGLAAAEGEAWARQRRAASPAFRPAAVEAAAGAMSAATRRAAARWSHGQDIELGTALGRVVTEVVLKALFAAGDDIEFDTTARDIPRVVREVSTFGPLDALPLPYRWIDRLRGLGRTAEEARLRRLAARLAGRAPDPMRDDLLERLRGVGPLAENALGFMLAGFETTALGAAWTLFLLALHPEWQARLRDGACASGNEPDARILARQVAQEALRLYPPAPVLVRSALRRTTLQGYPLRPGQAVLIPVYAIHRHRRLWDNPDRFDPARFGADARHERGAYLPFGAGPRLCIAATFALTEITVIVSELIRTFHFAPAGPPPEVSLRVSSHAPGGLRVTVERV